MGKRSSQGLAFLIEERPVEAFEQLNVGIRTTDFAPGRRYGTRADASGSRRSLTFTGRSSRTVGSYATSRRPAKSRQPLCEEVRR
jgi:hypothetical protein